MRFETTPHFRAITTRNQREAYRMWLLKRERRGDPAVCWGMYRWLAPQGVQARREAFAVWSAKYANPHRIRPDWCSSSMWDSFRKYQREVRADATIEEYRIWRETGKMKPPKHLAPTSRKERTIFERPVSDILAKFARLGLLPK